MAMSFGVTLTLKLAHSHRTCEGGVDLHHTGVLVNIRQCNETARLEYTEMGPFPRH
jgi:hypothetical protein